MSSLPRQYVRLMHFPLPLCLFSFATLGAIIAPVVHFDRLLWTYLTVFTSLCLASYCFDELKGRPLHTTIPESQLRFLGWLGLLASVLIGVYLSIIIDLMLLVWIPPAAFIIIAYNKELFHGKFHNGAFFSLGWAGIPVLGSFFLQTLTVSPSAVLVAIAAIVFGLAIWNLNHELRPDLDALQELTSRPDGDPAGVRRSTRRRIWKVTQILCYALTLFTVAFSYYRFFP